MFGFGSINTFSPVTGSFFELQEIRIKAIPMVIKFLFINYSKKINKITGLKSFFFSRKNGLSKGIYKSLNCGLGSNDKKQIVKKNIEIIAKKTGFK